MTRFPYIMCRYARKRRQKRRRKARIHRSGLGPRLYFVRPGPRTRHRARPGQPRILRPPLCQPPAVLGGHRPGGDRGLLRNKAVLPACRPFSGPAWHRAIHHRQSRTHQCSADSGRTCRAANPSGHRRGGSGHSGCGCTDWRPLRHRCIHLGRTSWDRASPGSACSNCQRPGAARAASPTVVSPGGRRRRLYRGVR